eukprot:GHVP01026294.1.p1 GENE.GHVP01026294.1~~GHVP01026294.1.p1  ORF type:complete len:782 (+),score=132.50 GHVP01026294.1:3-2348(+)
MSNEENSQETNNGESNLYNIPNQSTSSGEGNAHTDLIAPNEYFGSTTDDSTLDENNAYSSQQEESEDSIRVLWGTNIIVDNVMNQFKRFIKTYKIHHEEAPHYILKLQRACMTEDFFINLDCAHLRSSEETESLYRQLLFYPQEIIGLFELSIKDVFTSLYPEEEERTIKIRPLNIEKTKNMRELNPEDIDKLVCIRGLVIRTSNIIPTMKSALFICSICSSSQTVHINKGRIVHPERCLSNSCKGKKSMEIVHNRCKFSNKQIARVQELPDSIPDGQTPHTVTASLYDAHVDGCKPGDRIEITGIYRAAPLRVNPYQRKLKSIFSTYIEIAHVRVITELQLTESSSEIDQEMLTDSELHQIHELSKSENLYEHFVSSLAPSIWKMTDVKKSLLLQLFGGIEKTFSDTDGMKFRGDINILLAGDPGVSKSQLLLYVHKIAPRGMYTSGKGSSSVGLTAYVTKDPETSQNVLESGALVLSDGGICCIDEFDKMSQTTRAVLHEAMEQQTISVAKAGIITTLNARTSILASANPVDSKYNPKKTIVENINLPPTLLSRFDVICLLLDTPNEDFDMRLAEHIVSLYSRDMNVHMDPPIGKELMTKYIRYARQFKPIISESAKKAISEGYVAMRKEGKATKTISATARQLESIIRLSEAHAKMHLAKTVEEYNVEEAVRLIKESMHTYAVDPTTGKIDMDIISTGRSRSKTEHIQEIKNAIMDILKGKKRKSFSILELQELLQGPNSAHVQERSIIEAVSELNGEESVGLSHKNTGPSCMNVHLL